MILRFGSSPLNQAVQTVLCAPGARLFGESSRFAEYTSYGMHEVGIGEREATRISWTRGRLSLAHVARLAWKKIMAASDGGEHYVGFHQRNLALLLWNDLLTTVPDSLVPPLLEALKGAMEAEYRHARKEVMGLLIAEDLPWGRGRGLSHGHKLMVEELWSEAFRHMAPEATLALLEASVDTLTRLLEACRANGGVGAVRENLTWLCEAGAIGPDDLDSAEEALTLAAWAGSLAKHADGLFEVFGEDWDTFLGEWESEAGLAMGGITRLFAAEGAFSTMGLVQPSASPRAWMAGGERRLAEAPVSTLLRQHTGRSALFEALLRQRFPILTDSGASPHAEQTPAPGIDEFAHLGGDLRNLLAFAQAKKPLRLLLTGAAGAGKTAMALALAREAGVIPVAVADGEDARAGLVQRLGVLQRQHALLGPVLAVIDPADTYFGKDDKTLDRHLLNTRERQALRVSEIWTLRSSCDLPEAVLASFDLVVHLGPMPLAQREALAWRYFAQDVASRLAMRCSCAGDILGTARWAQATGCQDWPSLAARLSNLQDTLGRAKNADGSLPLMVYAPGQLALGFESVAGQPEAVASARRIIGCLKNPARFQAMGVRLPKGVLLTGGPGSGKTHLARAMAAEAGVPFLLADSAAMARMPATINAVFSEARRLAPCLLFLDELDAIGTTARGAGGASPDPERQGILNRLLMEMDGIETLDDVLVIGSTHRSELLDPALIRSGRLGWHVAMPEPDLEARLDLWRYYGEGIPCDERISWKRVARISSGMSPADIAQATNLAAMLAADQGLTRVEQSHLVQAIDQVLWKSETTDRFVLEDERWRTAVHEAGHALMAWRAGLEIERASIRPRSQAMGYIRTLVDDGRVSRAQTDLVAEISVCFGGIAGEEAVFSQHSTGAVSDLNHARHLCRQLVRDEGMHPQFPLGVADGGVSAQTLHEVERIETEVAREIREHTQAWIAAHRLALEAFAKTLLEAREMDWNEIEALFNRLLPEARGSEHGNLLRLAARVIGASGTEDGGVAKA